MMTKSRYLKFQYLSLNIPKMAKQEIIKETDKFAKDMKTQVGNDLFLTSFCHDCNLY